MALRKRKRELTLVVRGREERAAERPSEAVSVRKRIVCGLKSHRGHPELIQRHSFIEARDVLKTLNLLGQCIGGSGVVLCSPHVVPVYA